MSSSRNPVPKSLPEHVIRRKVDPVAAKAAQETFFWRMGGGQQFRFLFDQLPDVHFFAKDVHGHFVAGGRGVLDRLGFASEDEILGLTDDDIHPPRIAKEIRRDDEQVMRTRQPLIDRVEALFSRSHAKDWYVTTKLPIIDDANRVIGIMGFVRPFERNRFPKDDTSRLKEAVEYIHENHGGRIEVTQVAELSKLSQRQLNRKFHETFGMSVQEFIMRTRIQAASDELIQTDKQISEIAADCGFCDQSAFGQQFRKHTGETPLEFRRRNWPHPLKIKKPLSRKGPGPRK